MNSRPDILVLGAGGVLGEAWLSGVLAGLEDGAELDMRGCEYFVGTSAGALVAARLVAGERPRRPAPDSDAILELPVDMTGAQSSSLAAAALSTAGRAGAAALAISSPLVPAAMAVAAPGGAWARAAALRAAPSATGSLARLREGLEESSVRFDGRLRVIAVARASGRRVVFGRPHAPAATVAEAVEASCTIPWLFAAVTVEGVEYVDGGFWSPTNLDVAPAGRDTQVLCLSPTATVLGAGRLSALRGRTSRTLTLIEQAALRAKGARVELIAPDRAAAAAIGADLMARSRRERVLAAGYRQGLALAAGGP